MKWLAHVRDIIFGTGRGRYRAGIETMVQTDIQTIGIFTTHEGKTLGFANIDEYKSFRLMTDENYRHAHFPIYEVKSMGTTIEMTEDSVRANHIFEQSTGMCKEIFKHEGAHLPSHMIRKVSYGVEVVNGHSKTSHQ
jgi:hypothetical protein